MLQKFENYESKLNSIERDTVNEYINILLNTESKLEYMRTVKDGIIFTLSFNNKKYNYKYIDNEIYLYKFKAMLVLHTEDNEIYQKLTDLKLFFQKPNLKEKIYFYANMYRFLYRSKNTHIEK